MSVCTIMVKHVNVHSSKNSLSIRCCCPFSYFCENY